MDYCTASRISARKEEDPMRTMRLTMILGVCLLGGTGLLLADTKSTELRIGLMPAYNSIPLVVAEARKFYDAQGVSVALVPFNGQLERETALQTGALDGTVSDMINAIQSWAHGFGARVTSVSEGNFALLGSPGAARPPQLTLSRPSGRIGRIPEGEICQTQSASSFLAVGTAEWKRPRCWNARSGSDTTSGLPSSTGIHTRRS